VQASQQLASALTQAEPFRGAVQRLASRLIEQRVEPLGFVRQHATAPAGLPHVDLTAQRTTSRLHSLGRVPWKIAMFATDLAQRTNSGCFIASPHGHSAVTCARVSATAASSPRLSPHLARARSGAMISRADASNPKANAFIRSSLLFARRRSPVTSFNDGLRLTAT
jgi:hypothetical protein